MRLQGPSLALGCLRAIPVTTTAGAKQWVAAEHHDLQGGVTGFQWTPKTLPWQGQHRRESVPRLWPCSVTFL